MLVISSMRTTIIRCIDKDAAEFSLACEGASFGRISIIHLEPFCTVLWLEFDLALVQSVTPVWKIISKY